MDVVFRAIEVFAQNESDFDIWGPSLVVIITGFAGWLTTMFRRIGRTEQQIHDHTSSIDRLEAVIEKLDQKLDDVTWQLAALGAPRPETRPRRRSP